MTDRNRDLEQRGSNPGNQQHENRGTSGRESEMDNATPGSNRNQGQSGSQGIGDESGDRNRGQGNVGSSREGGTRPGNMEGDEQSNR